MFTTSGVNAPLPVELLSFYGKQVNGNVLLNWETATEINNSHFDVEWSKDGIHFEKIGEVVGAGTTNEMQFYDFLDDPNLRGLRDLLGLNYYRLKQVDVDGKFEYSNTIQISIDPLINSAINIFPNSATDYFVIENVEVGKMVQIFNSNGLLMKEFEIEATSHYSSISDFPNGIYLIKVGNLAQKLIVQK
jgi:hypothetical protein